MKISLAFFWLLRVVAALIMVQTLYFKFLGAPESIYIFTTVGMEPWGRFAVGVAELIASVLLLINRTTWIGAGLAFGLMLGAIGMHFTFLGVEVLGDGGYLFILANAVLLCAVYILYYERSRFIPLIYIVLKRS